MLGGVRRGRGFAAAKRSTLQRVHSNYTLGVAGETLAASFCIEVYTLELSITESCFSDCVIYVFRKRHAKAVFVFLPVVPRLGSEN